MVDKMNIDLEKARGEGFNLADIEILKDCEIKVNCADCVGDDCGMCPDQPLDKFTHFKPKQNELDNLFIGAPVMVKSLTSNDYYLSNYNPKATIDHALKRLRLPTVEEAPRNVWLAKWLKMPVELKKFNVLYRYKCSDVEYCLVDGNAAFGWDKVEAIMILEDLKK